MVVAYVEAPYMKAWEKFAIVGIASIVSSFIAPTVVPELPMFNWILILLAIFAIVYLGTGKKNLAKSP